MDSILAVLTILIYLFFISTRNKYRSPRTNERKELDNKKKTPEFLIKGVEETNE